MKTEKNQIQNIKNRENSDNIQKNELTQWHIIFGSLWEKLLTPVNLSVTTDFAIMSNPPKGDILLVRRNDLKWTKEQKERLPYGIIDSKADHFLVEFKFTESVNIEAVQQALAYDFFYKNSNKDSLSRDRVETFILSSKTPQKSLREKLGFTKQVAPGVFKNTILTTSTLKLISINDLSKAKHNEYIKCFASKKNVREKAFIELNASKEITSTPELFFIYYGLNEILVKKNRGEMLMEKQGYTPEDVINIGKSTYEWTLNSLSIDDFFKRFNKKEILSNFKPHEILATLSREEIEEYLNKNKK